MPQSVSFFFLFMAWPWLCRTYKRYYYFHDTTGESSWEYPEDEAKRGVTSSHHVVPAPPSHIPPQPHIPPPVQVRIYRGSACRDALLSKVAMTPPF